MSALPPATKPHANRPVTTTTRPQPRPQPRALKEHGAFARVLKSLCAPPPELHVPPPAPPPTPVTHERRGGEHPARADNPREKPEEPSVKELAIDDDPTWTHRSALIGPPPRIENMQVQAQHHVEHVSRHATIEQLAPQLLRKMAWSGDGKRGAARLEVGSGSLAGAVLTLEADGRDVALHIDGVAPHVEQHLRRRLESGLGARGFRLV